MISSSLNLIELAKKRNASHDVAQGLRGGAVDATDCIQSSCAIKQNQCQSQSKLFGSDFPDNDLCANRKRNGLYAASYSRRMG